MTFAPHLPPHALLRRTFAPGKTLRRRHRSTTSRRRSRCPVPTRLCHNRRRSAASSPVRCRPAPGQLPEREAPRPKPNLPQEIVPPYQQLQKPFPAEPARTPPAAPPTVRQPGQAHPGNQGNRGQQGNPGNAPRGVAAAPPAVPRRGPWSLSARRRQFPHNARLRWPRRSRTLDLQRFRHSRCRPPSSRPCRLRPLPTEIRSPLTSRGRRWWSGSAASRRNA